MLVRSLNGRRLFISQCKYPIKLTYCYHTAIRQLRLAHAVDGARALSRHQKRGALAHTLMVMSGLVH